MVNIYAEFTDLYPNKEPDMGKDPLPRAPSSGSKAVPRGWVDGQTDGAHIPVTNCHQEQLSASTEC